MDETQQDAPVNVIDPYKDYKVVYSQPFAETTISIKTEGDEIPYAQAQRLTANAHDAVELAYKVTGQEVGWVKGGLNINVRNKGLLTETFMTTSFDANYGILSEDDQTQKAAVLHELIEGIQEDLPNFRVANTEILPLLSEFLFCGKDRDKYFLQVTRQAQRYANGEKVGNHGQGWGKSVEMIARSLGKQVDIKSGTPEEILLAVAAVKNLDEEQKIDLIKSSIREFQG